MVLESRRTEINVKNFVLESPKKNIERAVFDPSDHLTNSDCYKIGEWISNQSGSVLIHQAAYAKLLDKRINVNITTSEWRDELGALREKRGRTDFLDYGKDALDMKILGQLPNRLIVNADLTKAKQENESDHDRLKRIQRAYFVKVLLPGKELRLRNNDLQTSTTIALQTADSINQIPVDFISGSSGAQESIYDMVSSAFHLRVVSPDKSIQFEKDTWDRLKAICIDKREDVNASGSYTNYLRLATMIKALACFEIRIDDKGMELIMEKKQNPLFPDAKTLPVQRSF